MGELPAPLRRERGEGYGRPAVGAPGVMQPRAHDVESSQGALDSAAGAPLGSTPSRHLVQSMFDALPINANQWQFRGSVLLEPNGDPSTDTRVVEFTVPEARVAILRRLEWTQSDFLFVDRNFSQFYYYDIPSPTSVEISIQGSVARTYSSLEMQAQQGDVPVYAIANEREIIQVRATSLALGTGIPSDWEVRVFFILTGNLLLNTGKETQYEPSNEQLESGMLR